MSDSEENPKNMNNLNNIFINSKINSSKGSQKIVNNTPQNMYINNGNKSKPINKTLIGGKKIESENQSDSEKSSEEDDDEENLDEAEENVDEADLENEDNEENLDEAEVEENAEGEEKGEEGEEIDEKTEDVEDVNNQETEYNEDGVNEKDTELKDDGTNECLYQFDDLIDAKDIYKQPTEVAMENRTTDPYITHYEKIRILGIRSKQISMGAKEMVKYDGIISAVELAKHELNNKTTPLVIKRVLPNNTYELWKVSELNNENDNNEIIIKDLNNLYDNKSYDLY
jgi:DNA-directed RNA polymerase I, II, and III subunit RPABC2